MACSSQGLLAVGWHAGSPLWGQFEPLPASGIVGPGTLCLLRRESIGSELGLNIAIRAHSAHGRVDFSFIGQDQSIEVDRPLEGRVSKETVTGRDLCAAVNNALAQQGIPFGRR
jgi:hypothetical protein